MCTKSMMASQGKQVVMLASGTVVAVAAAIFVQYARGIIRRKSREKLEQHIDDYISLEDLGALALHAPQVNLRRSAEQVVLDRAARPQYFSHILKCCLNNDDEESALKSITVLCVILKNVNFKELPDERKILSVLGTCFMRSIHQQKYKKQCKDVFLKQRVQSRLAGVMFDIICDMDERKMMLIWETEGILATILNEMQTTESKEVMRYCLFIVHQLCLCDGLVPELVESDCVPIICGMVVNYWGDTVIQRIGLQMLVLIINTQGIDEKKILAEIASHNVVMHAVVCLKSEENVLVYWAVALLHEFAVNEVLRDNICKLPYLMKSLQKALYGGQAGLQRLVLRVICFLALRNEPFKLEVLACNRILSRIPICLSSGDKDVVHWALVLTHDLAMIGKAAVEMLLSSCDGILQAMTPLANSPDSVLVRLLAETLGFFCCCEQLHHMLVKGGILTAVLYFVECHDPELTFWASALMLNLAMTSEAVKVELLKAGGLQTLVDLCIGQTENTQVVTMAAKTLSMLGYVDASLEVKVECDSESSSISVHGKPHHCNAPGINVMLWDTLANEEAIYQNLSLEQYPAIGELHLDIPCLNSNEGRNLGNIVFITIRGKHGDRYLKGLEKLLVIDKKTSFSGVTTMNELELPVNHTCLVVATLVSDNKLQVTLIDKSIKYSEIDLTFPYADIVNHRVTNLVLLPTIDLILNSPPSRNISRVSEMELLEVLARHPVHKDIMLHVNGFMDHLTSVISFCSDRGVSSFQSQPLPLAHCLGALRVLASLTTHDPDTITAGFLSQLSQQLVSCKKRELESQNLIGAIVALLFNISNIWIHSVLDNVTLEYHNVDRLSASKISMDAASVTNDQSSSSSIPGDQSETGNKNVDQSGNRQTSGRDSTSAGSPVHRDVVIETPPGDEIAVKSTSEISEDGQRKSRQSSEIDEYDEMYASLARFSVLILGNLATINDKETSRLCREVLCKSGAIHNLWCTLLCSGGPLKFSITVPTVYALTKLSCTEWKPFPTHGVLLNVNDKTAALLLTGDCLEVRNDNWTFESIRTQLPVNVSEMDEIPLGWYYEVTLKSSSIMQVGWASKHCHFSPEKGLGVGDDIHSYAFDGGRCKVWNGPITEQMNNDYGTEWRDGDIVSCLLCSDGSLSFWLNGVDCGVAFRDIDLGEAWYPACSLSTDQQIRFNFGATPFRNKMPDGFVPVNAVSQAGSYLDKRNANDSVPDLSGQSATTKPSMAWWVPLDNESESHDQEQPTEVAPEAGDDQDQPISSHSALNDILNRSFSPIGIDVTSDFGDNHHYSPISSGVRYDGAGDSQYPPMDDNIIVDIGDEDLSLQDGGGDQPCEPVNIDFMNDNADHGVYPPINTSLTDEDGAGDDTAYRPTIKDIADVGGGQAESHPPPSLYFEICLTCNDQRPLSFGFRNMDDSQSVQVVVCPDDTMLMPDGDKVKFSHQHQLILGCGLLLPPGACFFTINGQPIKFLYTFYDEEIGQGPLLPYISDPYLHLNVGDTYFMYEAGNEREIRLGMAALLHDYHESRILAHAALKPRQDQTQTP